jgi:serine/threonine protein kinase
MLEGQSYDHKVDYFSLGSVLYVLLSGIEPFSGATEYEKLQSNFRCLVQFTSSHWTPVSVEAQNFVEALMADEPANRLDYLSALSHKWIKSMSSERNPIPKKVSLTSQLSTRCRLSNCLQSGSLHGEVDSEEFRKESSSGQRGGVKSSNLVNALQDAMVVKILI